VGRGSVVAGYLVGMAISMLDLLARGFEGLCDIRPRRSRVASALILFGFKGVVLLPDEVGGAGEEVAEDFEELNGVEGVDVVVGAGTLGAAGALDDDDGDFGAAANGSQDFAAGNVADGCVEDDAVNAGKTLEGLDSFCPVVGRDHVELRGLDDELPHGDGGGVLAIDDQETRPDHRAMLRGEDVVVVM
jgi:hypothetical protein